MRVRQYVTGQDWLDARGTPGEDAALDRYGEAQAQLRGFTERVGYLRKLQQLIRLRAEAARREGRGS